MVRAVYRSALGKIPMSESILAGGAPTKSSVVNSTSLPYSNPGSAWVGEMEGRKCSCFLLCGGPAVCGPAAAVSGARGDDDERVVTLA